LLGGFGGHLESLRHLLLGLQYGSCFEMRDVEMLGLAAIEINDNSKFDAVLAHLVS
jgi:hypothetical protein